MRLLLAYLFSLVLGFFVSGPVLAQSGAEICLELARHLKQDVLMQGSTRQKFEEIKKLISLDEYGSWQKASQTNLDLGVNIPGYVDGILGQKSNEENWEQHRRQFIRSDYSQISSSASATTMIQKTNENVVATIADCGKKIAEANAQGFFGVLSSVTSARDGFSLKLFKKMDGANSRWEVRSLTAAPQDPAFHCEGYEKASPRHPISVASAAIVIGCSKSPNKEILVQLNSDAGPAGPYTITAFNDEIENMRERLASLETEILNTVPKNTVAHFRLETCPIGWTELIEARGMYIVGLPERGALMASVGTPLKDQENRPTGAHEHVLSATFLGYQNGAAGAQDGHNLKLEVPKTSGGVNGGAKEGTNAPYLQLITCYKQ
jgi:hypothetical protein